MAKEGILGRIFGRKAAPPRSSEARPAPAPVQEGGSPYEDLERAARGFVEEHRPLLDRGDPEVLERVFVEGANVFTAINPEAVAAANRAAAAKRALATAIRDKSMPALRFQEIKDEEALASRFNDSLSSAAGALSDFLNRVLAKLPRRTPGGA